MKRTVILTVVTGLVVLLNGWLASVFSPAFQLPDNVPEEATDKIIESIESVMPNEKMVESAESAQVSRVIDGDTIEVILAGGQTTLVRYIGIDTPEQEREGQVMECFATEAKARNQALVANQEVRLIKDVSETDKYGRLLRFVYLGDVLVNAELIKEGMAKAVTFPPDVSKAGDFRQLEFSAKQSKAGLWGSCN